MLKTVKDACTLDEGTLEYQAAAGIENLAEVIHDSGDRGASFFSRNYLTRGMEVLLREGLLRLSGQTDQTLFELAQAMGGGKTHLMSALGLLARYPEQRSEVLPEDLLQRIDDRPARVAVFVGRENPRDFLWGSIARQLGDHAVETLRPFWENGPEAPGMEHWKEAIGDDPTLILFDELPPYFQSLSTKPLGAGTQADVLTAALANLFAAALELPRCCIVLSNLEQAYADQIEHIHNLVGNIQAEADRHAKTVTPVALDGHEVYAILRKRLFRELPEASDIDEVADAFADQIKRAEDGGYLKARSLEQVAEEVRETYPFHPSFKHLVTLFKDNPKFRETRGLLQFAARVIRSVWHRPQNDVYLIGTQHLDLNDPQVRDEVIDINDSLRPAVTKDIADAGSSHAEEIDDRFNNDAASQIAGLLLSASLSRAVQGHTGLRYEEVIEYLLAPNRKPDEFAQAFEELRAEAWYLHREAELLYFKDTENLTRRIQNEAQGLSQARVDQLLTQWLESALEPRSRVAYQKLLVMPQTQEIQEEVSHGRVLVVVKPDDSVPPSEMRRLYDALEEKNHLLILSGNDTRMADRVETLLRELYAVGHILEGIQGNESLRKEAQEKKETTEQAFIQALQGTFNRLFFPGAEGLTSATIEQGLRFRAADQESAEKQIEAMLESSRCDHKLVRQLEGQELAYLSMAEQWLWPQGQRRIPWRDLLLRAKTMPDWPWMPGGKGMEQLKRIGIAQGRWRDTNDGYIEKGPFPKERTEVMVIGQEPDPDNGQIVLQLSTKNAGQQPRIHYATSSAISEQDPVVENPERFPTQAGTLYFLAIDPAGEHEPGEPTRWVARLTIRHQIHPKPMHREEEIAVIPTPEVVRYTLDGSNPREGQVYDGPFVIGDERQMLSVYACSGEAEATETFTIPERDPGGGGDDGERPVLDRTRPASLKNAGFVQVDGTHDVFQLIQTFKGRDVAFYGARLLVGEGEHGVQLNFNRRKLTPSLLEHTITGLREALGEPDAYLELKVREGADFSTGHDLEQFADIAGLELTHENVTQS